MIFKAKIEVFVIPRQSQSISFRNDLGDHILLNRLGLFQDLYGIEVTLSTVIVTTSVGKQDY